MNKLLVSLVLSLGMAGSVHAVQGDAEAGAGKVATCAACHGSDGNSAMPNFPKLAALGEKYLYKQLLDIKEGRRVVVEMTGILDPLNEQDLRDIAAFYDAQVPAMGVADAELATCPPACRPVPAAIRLPARVTTRRAIRAWLASMQPILPSS
jgi:cytochrome c553